MHLGKVITAAALAVFCLIPMTYAKDHDKHKHKHKHDRPVSVPEIDVGAAGSAFALLVGALALVHERRRQ
jgi:hypothetical protein